MSTYFIIHISIVSIPLIFSFDKRVHFYKKWKYAFPAILIPGLAFVVWDSIFTLLGVWNFNTLHISGVHIFNLPLEEMLFFITVPYASLFTYETIKTYWPQLNPHNTSRYVSILFAISLLVTSLIFFQKLYTSVTFLTLSVTIIILQFFIKSGIMGRFYVAYLIIFFPFTFFNGILTGSFIESPVVLYNDMENLGIRLLTIPIEDIFYGMLLILLNVSLFELFRKKLRGAPVMN